MQQWSSESLAATKRHLQTAQSELAKMSSASHTEGGAKPGFHSDVNRRLLGPLPPRPVQVHAKGFVGNALAEAVDHDSTLVMYRYRW